MTSQQFASYARFAIIKNLAVFRHLEHQIGALTKTSQMEQALELAHLAGLLAWSMPTGLLWSKSIEQNLHEIGQHASANLTPLSGTKANRVLHILTIAQNGPGGHVRMAARWIENDSAHIHDVLVTEQPSTFILSESLEAAVRRTNGDITVLWAEQMSRLQRIAAIREQLAKYEFVILHIHPHDATTVAALATETRPPTIFMNHADHVFWYGVSVADVIACFRQSALGVSNDRRNAASERLATLPLAINSARISIAPISRESLGIPQDAVVLISTAIASKFTPAHGVDFLAIINEFLKSHGDVHFIKLGGGEDSRWSQCAIDSDGRLHLLGSQPDVSPYLALADIFLDSMPTGSITALLEGAAFGLPCLSLSPPSCHELLTTRAYSDESTLIVTETAAKYTDVLNTLVQDKSFRIHRGSEAKESVERTNLMPSWLQHLEHVYELARNNNRATLPPDCAAPECSELEEQVFNLHEEGGFTTHAKNLQQHVDCSRTDLVSARQSIVHHSHVILQIDVVIFVNEPLEWALEIVSAAAPVVDQLENLGFIVETSVVRPATPALKPLEDMISGAEFVDQTPELNIEDTAHKLVVHIDRPLPQPGTSEIVETIVTHDSSATQEQIIYSGNGWLIPRPNPYNAKDLTSE